MLRPRKSDLEATIRQAHRDMSDLIGRWTDHVPPEVRAELHQVDRPLLEMVERLDGR